MILFDFLQIPDPGPRGRHETDPYGSLTRFIPGACKKEIANIEKLEKEKDQEDRKKLDKLFI